MIARLLCRVFGHRLGLEWHRSPFATSKATPFRIVCTRCGVVR